MSDDHLLVQSDDTEDRVYGLIPQFDSLAFGPLLYIPLLGEHRIRLDPPVELRVIPSQEKHQEAQEPEDADARLQHFLRALRVFEGVGHVPWFVALHLFDLRCFALVQN